MSSSHKNRAPYKGHPEFFNEDTAVNNKENMYSSFHTLLSDARWFNCIALSDHDIHHLRTIPVFF